MAGAVATHGPTPAPTLLSRVFAEVLTDATERRLDAREWLFRAGEAAESCFVLLAGRLEVVVETAEGSRVVRVLGPGAALGEALRS